jgi:hypothetical protein
MRVQSSLRDIADLASAIRAREEAGQSTPRRTSRHDANISVMNHRRKETGMCARPALWQEGPVAYRTA